MKKLFYLATLIFVLSSCSKDEEVFNSLEVSVHYKNQENIYLAPPNCKIYIYEDISYYQNWEYIGNGKISNGNTEVVYTEMSTGAIVIFSGLKMKTYAVVVDMSDILNDKMDKKVWGMSTNLGNELNKNGGELDFEIDIWPYDPWDIEK